MSDSKKSANIRAVPIADGPRFAEPGSLVLPPGYKPEDWHIWGPDGKTPLVIVKPDGFVWLRSGLTMADVKVIFREMAKAMRAP